jgi:hypothetical protein
MRLVNSAARGARRCYTHKTDTICVRIGFRAREFADNRMLEERSSDIAPLARALLVSAGNDEFVQENVAATIFISLFEEQNRLPERLDVGRTRLQRAEG